MAPIKVLVMMTGEIEYNDLYYPRDNVLAFNMTKDENGTFQGNGAIDEHSSAQYFPLTAHFILTVFIVVIAIVIMNLLFGIAVSDVQVGTYKSRRMLSQAHNIVFRISRNSTKWPGCTSLSSKSALFRTWRVSFILQFFANFHSGFNR